MEKVAQIGILSKLATNRAEQNLSFFATIFVLDVAVRILVLHCRFWKAWKRNVTGGSIVGVRLIIKLKETNDDQEQHRKNDENLTVISLEAIF